MLSRNQEDNATTTSAPHDFNIFSGTGIGVYKLWRLTGAKHERGLIDTDVEYASFRRKISCVLFRCTAVQVLY
jgi:hypothetical protein